jgi:hypothetical protein
MGMFDSIRCLATLPVVLDVDHRKHWFQTKSLCNHLDLYEIREDGSLWVERFEVEDCSAPLATGLERLLGLRTRVNKRFERVEGFTGEIDFYTFASEVGHEGNPPKPSGWLELVAFFARGEMKHLELLCFEEPEADQ